jgi:pSer/pThr/pTyr-binding forkhead associated (FHA) protein
MTKSAVLLQSLGQKMGCWFLLTRSALIGRSPESEVFLDDVTVSRRHALVTFTDTFSIKDLGSLNGTYVNGQPMIEVSLSSGDEIQIGKFHMLFFRGK